MSDGNNNFNCVQSIKKQRFDTDFVLTPESKNDHLTFDQEVIQASTMTKLSCFRKDFNARNSSAKNICSTAQNSREQVDEHMELDNDRRTSSGISFSGDDIDDVQGMDATKTETLQKDLNLDQFACASTGPVLSKTKLTATQKSERNGSKNMNCKPKSAYTPLELQFLEVKSKYADVILFVECGYRYRFFGEDAEVILHVCFSNQCT